MVYTALAATGLTNKVDRCRNSSRDKRRDRSKAGETSQGERERDRNNGIYYLFWVLQDSPIGSTWQRVNMRHTWF
ncbi:hypothetical protein E2C01_000993 [Portunus trituberculatus]|uniref:Uncharacterized protein n=1 Tax=Portunus trituberculatus TaxID=210409 RepID=A0A5B7CG31_PORTR|nr:hypothetical protein [Portunus trituberculatus]